MSVSRTEPPAGPRRRAPEASVDWLIFTGYLVTVTCAVALLAWYWEANAVGFTTTTLLAVTELLCLYLLIQVIRSGHVAEEQEQFLQAVLDSVQVGIVACDRNGTLSLFNDAARELHGLGEEPLPAEHWAERYDLYRTDGKTLMSMEELPLFRAFRGEQVRDAELMIVPPRGPARRMLASGRPLLCKAGRKLGAVVAIKDITACKRAEEMHQLNEKRLESLLRLSRMITATPEDIANFALEQALLLAQSRLGFIGFVSADETTITTKAWSQEAAALCAVADKCPTFSVQSAGLWGEVLRHRQPLMINDYAAPHPAKRGYPQGHVAIHRLLVTPVFDGGRIVLVAAVANKDDAYDDTDLRQLTLFLQDAWNLVDRRRQEAALRDSEEKYRALAEHTNDLPYATDGQGIVKYIGPQIRRYGFCQEEVQSRSFLEFVFPDDRLRIAADFQRSLAAGQGFPNEFRVTAKDGSVHWLEDRGQPQYDAAGQPTGLTGVLRDITQRKDAEEALRQKDEELRHAQKMEAVGQLAGGIAHEFNNLLQAIGGYTALALEGLAPAEQRYQDLQEVRKATDRAANLTSHLLGFSRRRSLKPQNLDPNQTLRDVVKLIRPVIGENIELHVDCADQVGGVYADPGELEQVLMNLLVNARDAMPAGGHLHVGTRRVTVDGAPGPLAAPLAPGNYVLLSVTDTGCGMTPEVQQRIFEPFFTTKDVGKGTGLGLAHVYGIVQQHRGTIHVSSAPGHGTTFQIYLPTVERESDGEPPQSLVPATAGARAGARAETILLAEDEPIVRELAVRMLTAAGYTVLEAADGEEAVRLFAEHRERIALSLLDVVMPRLDGHAAFRRMCEAQPDARVIFCTGYDPETARTEGLIEARHPLIEKPYSPQVLLNTVRRVIDAEASCLVA